MNSIRRKHIGLAGFLALLLVLCPQASPTFNGASSAAAAHRPPRAKTSGIRHWKKVEDLVFAMTNQARKAHGVPPVAREAKLRKIARAGSDDMLVRKFFSHTTPDGEPFDRRIKSQYPLWVRTLGENIWEAYGYEHNSPQRIAQLIMSDWMSSPGHRKNILDPDYTDMGVGVSVRGHLIKVTQEFVGKCRTPKP
jgi:uncharacterized protein YkwD